MFHLHICSQRLVIKAPHIPHLCLKLQGVFIAQPNEVIFFATTAKLVCGLKVPVFAIVQLPNIRLQGTNCNTCYALRSLEPFPLATY